MRTAYSKNIQRKPQPTASFTQSLRNTNKSPSQVWARAVHCSNALVAPLQTTRISVHELSQWQGLCLQRRKPDWEGALREREKKSRCSPQRAGVYPVLLTGLAAVSTWRSCPAVHSTHGSASSRVPGRKKIKSLPDEVIGKERR